MIVFDEMREASGNKPNDGAAADGGRPVHVVRRNSKEPLSGLCIAFRRGSVNVEAYFVSELAPAS